MSERTKGENNGMFGRKHSPETLEKLREASAGVLATDETRKKMSDAHSGKNNSMHGRTGAKNPTSKPVRQLSLDRKIVIAEYAGVAEAERQLRANGIKAYKQSIGLCCRNTGKIKSTAGFCWEYIDSTETSTIDSRKQA